MAPWPLHLEGPLPRAEDKHQGITSLFPPNIIHKENLLRRPFPSLNELLIAFQLYTILSSRCHHVPTSYTNCRPWSQKRFRCLAFRRRNRSAACFKRNPIRDSHFCKQPYQWELRVGGICPHRYSLSSWGIRAGTAELYGHSTWNGFCILSLALRTSSSTRSRST